MPHVERDGTRIYWETHGEGPPLLLVMGFGLGREAWVPLLPFLGPHRVVLVDNRGTGLSDAPAPGLVIADMADDCAAVLDAAGIESANVHGVSMGGMIAQELALRHPGRVRSLVLGCTTPSVLRFVADQDDAIALFTGTAMLGSDPEAALDILLPVLASDPWLRANPDLRTLALSTVTAPVSPEAAELTMKAIIDLATGYAFDTVDRLGEIRCPTLVQHGSADRIIPVAAGRFLGEHIAGARYQELEGAGHLYNLEQPGPVFSSMLEFLAAHAAVA